MLTAITLLLFSVLPVEPIPVDHVDLIELNHFYDEQGRLVFDQHIFYHWSAGDARYMVRAWRLIKNPDQVIQRDWRRDDYFVLWKDSGQGREKLRMVRAPHVRETWLQYDPELADREYLPKESRRPLSGEK